MDERLIKSIFIIIVAVILLSILVSIIKWAVLKLLPVLLIIGAIYVIYRLATGKKIFRN